MYPIIERVLESIGKAEEGTGLIEAVRALGPEDRAAFVAELQELYDAATEEEEEPEEPGGDD